jgi:LPXTG-motif cell wall-anchored protein
MDKQMIWQLVLGIALLISSGLIFYLNRKIK